MTEATPLTDEELRFAREDMGMCPPVTSQDVMHDRLLATISADREKIRELTDRLEKAEAVIVRLASMRAFCFARVVDPDRDDELLARICYAESYLKETPK